MTAAGQADWTPMILAVAPNGARKTQADHPAIPITPAELAATAAAAEVAGAAMIHLHVRDADLKHSIDVGAYREATAALRESVGDRMIIQVTSEAVGIFTRQQQMAMVRELQPEAVSLAIREIIPEGGEAEAGEFLAWLIDAAILPQYILYAPEDVERFGRLQESGVIPPGPAFLLFVLGRYTAGQRSVPNDLLPYLSTIEAWPAAAQLPWAVCAFGTREIACVTAAATLGGHARVGFENNLFLPSGAQARDNAELVAAAAAAAAAFGRPLADAATARRLMGG